MKALSKRISEQGDMHIRVSAQTLTLLLREAGVKRDLGDDPFREVDAVVLDALLEIAWSRQPKPVYSDRHRFNPHKKYPWFCAECGYGPSEPLKHILPSWSPTPSPPDL